MPRGRLIWPMIVDIASLDTAAVAADPDAAGPLTSGYDADFGEPRVVPPSSGSAVVEPVRVEVIRQLRAQVQPSEQDQLQMGVTGRMPATRVVLVFHYHDLEAAGLVTLSSGRPVLRGPGDRLAAVRHPRTLALIEEYPVKPGLFATQVRSASFGLGPTRNLLFVTFEQRDLSVTNSA
jgi:hypothetical protein